MDNLTKAMHCAEKMRSEDKASEALGIEVEIDAVGFATARMRVREHMLNGFEVCHGGLLFALADTAFAFACNSHGRMTFAASGNIEFLRPSVLGDLLQAVATEEYHGRKNGFYTVTIKNQAGELIALFRGRSVSGEEPILNA